MLQPDRGPQTASIITSGPSVWAFSGGRWFDGERFVPRRFWCVEGRLTDRAPRQTPGATLDLGDGYVLPAFGDAHCHHFDGPNNVDEQVAMYLRDGVFYAKVPTNLRTGAAKVAAKVNRPDSVDVRYAHGGLTGTHSHPGTSYEARALGIFGYEAERQNRDRIRASRVMEGDAYYTVDTAADFARQWPRVRAGKPDFLKVYLLRSERYAARKAKTGEGDGLDPALLPRIVSQAHRDGLTVTAHVDSAFDYRVALRAGVDEMAHLCGYYIAPTEDPYEFALTDEDVRETARRRVTVIPTVNAVAPFVSRIERKRIREIQVRNLARLRAHGARFAIGSDSYGKTPLDEFFALRSLAVWSDLELLRLYCEQTPRHIFPRRKIGRLQPGYEANFVVLGADPLRDLEAVRSVRLRFKQGHRVGG